MTKSRKNNEPDVLIIGGGAAGLSAFKWCAELGLSARLAEKNTEFGGQMLSIHNTITNYLGRTAENGRDLLAHFLLQIDDLETCAVLNSSVVEFDPNGITATLSNGDVVNPRATIIATGVRRRSLGVPGEREFVDRGILESGARDKTLVTGKRVAIIGGGDAALENALILSDFADKVYVIHRRSEFRGRPEFIKAATVHPAIEFILNSTVTKFEGDEQLSAVQISDGSSLRTIDADAALIRIGVQPNSEVFSGKIDLDKSGYIKIDHLGATNVPNVYAAGDVTNPVSPTISSAVGCGATTAKAIFALIYGRSSL